MGEGQDNGFVERPTTLPPFRGRSEGLMSRMRATANNGKAVRLKKLTQMSGSGIQILRAEGFRVRRVKQPDGTYLAWCERIDAASGASRPEGARP